MYFSFLFDFVNEINRYNVSFSVCLAYVSLFRRVEIYYVLQ